MDKIVRNGIDSILCIQNDDIRKILTKKILNLENY